VIFEWWVLVLRAVQYIANKTCLSNTYYFRMTGLMSWTRMKHCMNMDMSRVSLVVWMLSEFDLKLRIARISRLVSQYVYSRRECTEGKGPPVGREGSRNRCRPRGHTRDYICLQGHDVSAKVILMAGMSAWIFGGNVSVVVDRYWCHLNSWGWLESSVV
jgi:hypothetical protein